MEEKLCKVAWYYYGGNLLCQTEGVLAVTTFNISFFPVPARGKLASVAVSAR